MTNIVKKIIIYKGINMKNEIAHRYAPNTLFVCSPFQILIYD